LSLALAASEKPGPRVPVFFRHPQNFVSLKISLASKPSSPRRRGPMLSIFDRLSMDSRLRGNDEHN
jgi:hypothetical protein